MSKVYKLKLINLSRRNTWGGNPQERREWIAQFMRNHVKTQAAIQWLGDRWVLSKKVERKTCRS